MDNPSNMVDVLQQIETIDGIFPFYKPSEITSSDFVQNVKTIVRNYYMQQIEEKNIKVTKKRIKRMVKIGHGGTLDKNAEGVLVIGIGKGTKKMAEYLSGDKKYEGRGILGKQTDTLDPNGKIIKTSDYEHVTNEMLENICASMVGEQVDQLPPVYSALKVKGKRMSDIARDIGYENAKKLVKPRKINIYEMEFMEKNNNEFVIRACVSGGTYIRSIIRDIGELVGSCAYMNGLVRMKQGVFSHDQTIVIGETGLEINDLISSLDIMSIRV